MSSLGAVATAAPRAPSRRRQLILSLYDSLSLSLSLSLYLPPLLGQFFYVFGFVTHVIHCVTYPAVTTFKPAGPQPLTPPPEGGVTFFLDGIPDLY